MINCASSLEAVLVKHSNESKLNDEEKRALEIFQEVAKSLPKSYLSSEAKDKVRSLDNSIELRKSNLESFLTVKEDSEKKLVNGALKCTREWINAMLKEEGSKIVPLRMGALVDSKEFLLKQKKRLEEENKSSLDPIRNLERTISQLTYEIKTIEENLESLDPQMQKQEISLMQGLVFLKESNVKVYDDEVSRTPAYKEIKEIEHRLKSL